MQRRGIHGTLRASTLDLLALTRTRLGGKESDLLPLALEALHEYEGDSLTKPHELSAAYSHLGVIYHNMNSYDQALAWYQKAIDIDSKPSSENFSYAADLLRLGATHYWMGHWREASGEHKLAIAMFDRLRPEGHPTRAALLTLLCDEAVALEQREAAQRYCSEVLKVAQ